VVALYEALADMALAGRAYTYKRGMSRKPGGRFKWLIPAALYGQVGGELLGGLGCHDHVPMAQVMLYGQVRGVAGVVLRSRLPGLVLCRVMLWHGVVWCWHAV
jgi:hypothetical protein